MPFSPPPPNNRLIAPADDDTDVCGVRILSKTLLNITNLYRPPIRRAQDDERQDPSALLVSDAPSSWVTLTPTRPG